MLTHDLTDATVQSDATVQFLILVLPVAFAPRLRHSWVVFEQEAQRDISLA
jgi:hypothetical protein